MSGTKILTPGEIRLLKRLYNNGQTNLRLLTIEINRNREKNNRPRIKSINTVKNYLVKSEMYISKSWPNEEVNFNKILVDHNTKTEIMKLIKTTYPTIRSALNGKSATELSLKIRSKAIELGGIEKL